MLHKYTKNTKGIDYIVGDIHGCYSLLMGKLKEIGFNKEVDRLFSVGDLVDRGPDSLKCLSLVYEDWFYPVMGNHEILMHNAVNGQEESLWFMNGGTWYLSEGADDMRILVNDVMEKLPLAIELETETGTVGIIHADVGSNVWGDFDEAEDVWSRTRIARRFDMGPVEGIDIVVVGHTPLKRVARVDNVVYIDTGAFATSNLTIIRADEAAAVPEETR